MHAMELLFLQAVFTALLVNFTSGQQPLSCSTGDVRLVGGGTNLEGRVEVCSDGAWGTVCDDGWTNAEASVVCGQLGHSHDDAVARVGAYFGRGTGDIVLDDVSCSGYEDRLIDCSHRGLGVDDCNHYEDAGVVCAPLPNVTFIQTDLSGIQTEIEAIRLVNGDTNYMGRMEVLYNGTWGTVCDDFWSYSDAKVACSMLGYGDAVCAVTSNQFGQATSSVPFWMDNVQCSGTEEALDQCSFPGWANNNCNHAYNDAGVICKSEDVSVVGVPYNIRLAESTTTSLTISWSVPKYPAAAQSLQFLISYESNVYLNPQSTTIYLFSGVQEGDTVTRTLGALTRDTEYNVQIRAQVQFSACSVSMLGAFSDVMTFRTNNTLKPSNYSVRLVSPYSSGADFLGRVEVLYNGQWGTVCDSSFSSRDADVMCRMAGYTDAICTLYNARYGRGSGPIWLYNIGCSSGDEVLEDCSRLNWGSYYYGCNHYDDVGVICRPNQDQLPSVRNLAVRSASSRSLTITWEAYTFPRGISRSYFDVYYSYIPGSWNSINSISGSLTQYTLYNLIFERQYNITIRPRVTYSSCYTSITGPFSSQVNATTMESAPGGPPSQFNIEAINETAIEVLWGLPASNVRNGIIRGYKLFVQARGGQETTMNITNNNTEAFIIGGLQPRTAYTVSILAYTAVGDGPRSIRLTTVTRTYDRTLITGFGINGNNLDAATRSYFSSPIHVHCIASDASPNMTVEWFFANGTKVRRSSNIGVLAYSNGTAVLQLGIYRGLLTYCEGGRYTCVVNTTSGRSEKRTFHLKIGSSIPQPSSPDYSKRGGNFVTLTWGESFCDGGREISGFTIRYRRTSRYSSYSYITISNPAQRSYPVRGLRSSTTYRFSIQATATDGTTSSYTSETYVTTLPSPPYAPRNVFARLVGPLLVQVSWTRPSVSNGAITEYRVYATPVTIPLQRKRRQLPTDVIEKVFSGSATSGNITLLRHNVFYEFQVSAATTYGSSVNEGSPSTVTTNTAVFVPDPGLPKPVNVGISRQTNVSLTVSWDYPPPPIGTVITNFIVTYSGMVEWRSPGGNLVQFEDSGEATVNSRSITLSPLISGTNYSVKVSAVTPRGRGEEISTTGAVLNSVSQESGSLAYFQLRLSPVINCQNYLAFSGNITEKLLNVRSAIIRELVLMCPRCGLTTANIRDDEFSCRGGLTNQIVYRAMIIGTTTSSPADLVSLIQSWVRGGAANIRVSSGTRLYIDRDCDTPLDTLWDPDCPLPMATTSTPPPTISTTTISTTEPDTTAPTTTTMQNSGTERSVGDAEPVVRGGLIGGVVIAVVIVLLIVVLLVVLIVTIVKWKVALSDKSEGQIRGRSITSLSNRESAQFEFNDDDNKEEYTL